jgi:hypothetical protein
MVQVTKSLHIILVSISGGLVNVNLEIGSVGYRWQHLLGLRHLLNALGIFV